jgi:hypothetical protein
MLIDVNSNRRNVICAECYKELGYGRCRISSTVQFNDAICRINYGLHNVLLGRKGAISCCQTFEQSTAYSLMTLIILSWQKARSNPGLCFSDVMETASCEMTLWKLLHKQLLSVIYKVLCACNFVTGSFRKTHGLRNSIRLNFASSSLRAVLAHIATKGKLTHVLTSSHWLRQCPAQTNHII